ncbi:hypothetical protein CHS0354_037826 [Potamilus streckersoni]|uniref:RING-type domain-containing protein n=1 Tax=Potamilus streckersoni TaxID=2493646 RepID=A0AAE0SJL7_9BIVA|nr:hypothetical protein CHS0354_037826 [Potamilus streckersoni]
MAEATDNDTTMQPADAITDFHICSNCPGNLQDTATSCGHRYCLTCIMQWLDNMTCPCWTIQLFQNSMLQDQLFHSFIDHLPRHAQTLKKHLEMTIETCQKEIKLLKDQIAFKEQHFKKETDNLLQKLSVAQSEIKEKEQQWNEIENKFENEKNNTRLLMEELEKSQHNRKMFEAHVEFLEGENAMLKDQLGSLQHIDETCRLLDEKFTKIEQDRRSLIGEIDRTSSENQELIKQVEEYKWWSLMRQKPDVSQLKQELADANENKERMHQNIKSLLNQIDRLTEDLYKKEQKLIHSRHFIILEQ